MGGRIENLGDYNKARLMLQKKGGDLSVLIKDIKNVGAREALPRQLGAGLLAGTAIGMGGGFAAHKISVHIKKEDNFEIKNWKKGWNLYWQPKTCQTNPNRRNRHADPMP